MNAAARSVIGPDLVARLERTVAATIHGASLHQGIKVLAETGQPLAFAKDKAPESWGGAWEDEMARIGRTA